MKRILLISWVFFFSPCIYAKEKWSQLDELVQTYLPSAQVGLLIQDAHTQEILYARNATQGFTPASLVKSYTAAAALLTLNPHFRYTTELRHDKNSLQGDIALIFSGDPTFSSQELHNLLNTLGEEGIKTIQGNIIIDNTYFPKPEAGRGWVAEDFNWYFGAPAQTVIVDGNQIAVTLTPAKVNQKASVALTDNNVPVTLHAQVTTVSESEANTLCQLNVESDPRDNSIDFYGCWPQSNDPKSVPLKVALPNPELYVKHLIEKNLQTQGITLQGEMLIGPSSAPDLLATYQSPTLIHLTEALIQQSNNLYADSLAKVLGKNRYQRGTLQAGSFAILEILKKQLNLDTNAVRLYDGSGLSTYNQITPKVTAQLLQAMYNQPKYQQDYLKAMQVNDVNHTFYNRIPKNLDADLYLKTGAITGVSNIAGYVKTASGKTLILVCLMNQLPLNKTKAREFEQQLLRLMADS